jgi:hypothetical protein
MIRRCLHGHALRVNLKADTDATLAVVQFALAANLRFPIRLVLVVVAIHAKGLAILRCFTTDGIAFMLCGGATVEFSVSHVLILIGAAPLANEFSSREVASKNLGAFKFLGSFSWMPECLPANAMPKNLIPDAQFLDV